MNRGTVVVDEQVFVVESVALVDDAIQVTATLAADRHVTIDVGAERAVHGPTGKLIYSMSRGQPKIRHLRPGDTVELKVLIKARGRRAT